MSSTVELKIPLQTLWSEGPQEKFFKIIIFIHRILSSIVRTFYMQNDAEIFPVHYTWKVAEKGFKMACMMNKLAMINSCEIILEK